VKGLFFFSNLSQHEGLAIYLLGYQIQQASLLLDNTRLECAASTNERLDIPILGTSSLSGFYWAMFEKTYAVPILNTFVPQDGQTPWVAGLPFFMVMLFGSLISFLVRHFTQ
jgi:hypothetical protein